MELYSYYGNVSFKDLYIGVYANDELIWYVGAEVLEDGSTIDIEVPYEGLYSGTAEIRLAICRQNALGEWVKAYYDTYVCDLDFSDDGPESFFGFEAQAEPMANTILLNGLWVYETYDSSDYEFKVYV